MTKKSISRLLQASLMCCLTVLFAACDDIFASEDNPTPAYLSMSEAPVTLKVGDTYRRKAISVTTAVVEYTSSKTDVATVDNEGLVTAKAEGTTTITATATGYSSQNGKKIYQPASVSYVVTVKAATLPAATITTAPKATASVAAGSATDLVTAGVADGGTMMYQVTTTNAKPTTTDDFSATVPTAAKLAGGTCYVWYYAKGDTEHSDSEIAATAIEVTVTEVYAANEYKEGSWDSTNKKVVFNKKTATASVTAVTNSDAAVTWSAGWYTVSGNVTINGDVKLTADAHLILQDGAKLTITGKLDGYVAALARNLYIYGQEKGDGKLIVENNSGTAIQIGDKAGSGKDIEIHGGEITAKATGVSGPGIYSSGIKVYGGKLTAESKATMGIQFGKYSGGDNFEVYGGEVVATSNATSSSDARYGITSVGGSATQILKVYGGKVTATGNGKGMTDDYGSGIACYVWSATSGIKFYFSDNGTTWDNGFNYGIANSVGFDNPDTKKRYAKAE